MNHKLSMLIDENIVDDTFNKTGLDKIFCFILEQNMIL